MPLQSQNSENSLWKARSQKRRTITTDLTIILVLAVLFASTIVISLNFLFVTSKARAQLEQKADEYMSYIMNSLELPLWNFDEESVIKIGKSYINNELVAAIQITGATGTIIFDSVKENEKDLIEKAGKVVYRGETIGNIKLSLTSRLYKKNNRQLLWSSILTMLVIIFALIGVTGFLLRVFLKNPLNDLIKGIDQIAQGNYEYKFQKAKQWEIERIILRFNEMTEKIKSREKSLSEINRRLKDEITERKGAEEALRKEKIFTESALDTLTDAFIVFDLEGKFLRWNKIMNKVTGYSDEEISLMQPSDFFLGEDVHRISETIDMVLKEGYGSIEVFVATKEGSRIPYEFTGGLLRDHEGDNLSICVVGRDIAERKRAEEALRASEEKLTRSKKMESLGLLAGGVAHDLNNVLSGIVSYPELLLLDLPQKSKLRKPIETIQETGHRAAAIVQDLLTVARGVAITREPLNLNVIIEGYLGSPEFKKLEQFHATVTIKIKLDTDLLNIEGSDAHLRKVVMNLVSNAAEAMEGSGNVIISTMNRYVDRPIRGYDDVSVGEYAVLSVSDDGPGISPDDLERIFEPFYTKKVMGRSGTGLGLAVVWNIVQDLKGYLDVISGDSGTTFELYFPITRDKVVDKDLSIPIDDYKGDGETVLVVDDVESQREIACKMLETLGYKTNAVSSGEEAVEYLTEHTVDLILLDMIMDPGINGRETYEQIIKIHPNQKAVIASGFAETDDVKKAQRLGAGPYIKKPLTLEKMGIAVRDELKK